MNGWGGLIELVLVFGLVLGFAVYELMSLRRYKTRRADEAGRLARTDGPSADAVHPDEH